jgi:hypothetical protein
MRRAVITIEWVGPDKPMREFIDDRLDEMFESMTWKFGEKLGFATSSIEYQSKAKS